MIATVHLADLGPRNALSLLARGRARLKPPGLRYALLSTTAPLSGNLLPRPNLARVGLIGVWDDDQAIDRFLADHPLAARLARGWHVRLQPTHVFGSWPAMPDLLAAEVPMDDAEPAAVLTIGRLRLSQGPRFLRASAEAETAALADPALLAATGMARPPALVATFSLWRSTAAMRAYAQRRPDRGHLAAVRAHAARPFHHESAFIRFRPYAAAGEWDGGDPLAGALASRPRAAQEPPATAQLRG